MNLSPRPLNVLLAAVVVLPWFATASLARRADDLYSIWTNYPVSVEADITRNQLDGWSINGPIAWTASNGYLETVTEGDAATAILLRGSTWTGMMVETSYTITSSVGGAGGLVLRATEDFIPWKSGSGYMLAAGYDGTRWHFAAYRQLEGSVGYIEEWTPLDDVKGSTVRLAAIADGANLELAVNGKSTWKKTDRRIKAGRAGLFATTSEGQTATHAFADIHVHTAPAEPDEAPAKSLITKPVESQAETTAPEVVASEPGSAGAQRRADDTSPELRPGFQVRVTVLASGKREIDAEVKRVSDSSELELPLIGKVSVAGLTLSQLNDDLQVRYREYFINPQVIAEFVVDDSPESISPWGSVVVLGRVKTPGRVNIPPTQDLTVSEAIQRAGGFDTSARMSSIRVTRRKADGGTERLTVDFTAIGSRGSVENDLTLRPGDVIFVPERIF